MKDSPGSTFRITFLGTGGGRHSAMYQTRSTGGMLVQHDNGIIHIDPGPGAVNQLRRIHHDPADTDAVVISHAHPDHYSDAEVVIEGMTCGGWKKKGHFYGSISVTEGKNNLGPCITNYHKNITEGCHTIAAGDEVDIAGLRVSIKKAIHNDPENIGFVFHPTEGDVAYVSDTEFTEEIAKQYIGVKVLILPVTTPDDNRIRGHLCAEDAIKFIDIVRPELTIFIHLGIVVLYVGADNQAKKVADATGRDVIAGRDLMILELDGDGIIVRDAEVYEDEWFPPSAPLDPTKFTKHDRRP